MMIKTSLDPDYNDHKPASSCSNSTEITSQDFVEVRLKNCSRTSRKNTVLYYYLAKRSEQNKKQFDWIYYEILIVTVLYCISKSFILINGALYVSLDKNSFGSQLASEARLLASEARLLASEARCWLPRRVAGFRGALLASEARGAVHLSELVVILCPFSV